MPPGKTKEDGTERYKLAPGAQVRAEDFGLLFYHRAGPRLYFLNSGAMLGEDFFAGEFTLEKWMCRNTMGGAVSPTQIRGLKKNLYALKEKGVILEC